MHPFRCNCVRHLGTWEWMEDVFVHVWEDISDPLSKNASSAFQILCKLLSFKLKDSWIKLVDDQRSSITKGGYLVLVYNFLHLIVKIIFRNTRVVADTLKYWTKFTGASWKERYGYHKWNFISCRPIFIHVEILN